MARAEVNRADETEAVRRNGKSAAAFWTTGEVAEELDLPAHVLRFWESKFPQVKPLKRGGGRRYYRPEDVDLLRRIRQCLYQEGYTIRGVQKLLRDGALRTDRTGAAASRRGAPIDPVRTRAGRRPSGSLDQFAWLRGKPCARRSKSCSASLLEIRALLDKLAPP